MDQLVTDFGRTRNLVGERETARPGGGSKCESHARASAPQFRSRILRRSQRASRPQRSAGNREGSPGSRRSNQRACAEQLALHPRRKFRRCESCPGKNDSRAGARMTWNPTQAELSAALGMSQLRLTRLRILALHRSRCRSRRFHCGSSARPPRCRRAAPRASIATAFRGAERDLWMPDVALAGVAGEAPFAQSQIPQNYGAIGVRCSHSNFQRKIIQRAPCRCARSRTANLREQLRDLENNVTRDVRVAWLAANTAFQNLALTAQLLRRRAESARPRHRKIQTWPQFNR